ncbi:MAG: hypothetical protein ACUVTR_02060 [Dehalococcoidia bacterium]
MQSAPRVLSPEEIRVWGLPEMIPIFPPEEILSIEGKWSKVALQKMAVEYFLSPAGDKALLIAKLLYIGALDEKGEPTKLPVGEPTQVPYVIGDPKKFCCRLCGACAPKDLLEKGRFLDRIAWLREHYKVAHPGVWGKRGRSVPATERDKDIWYLGEWWEYEYSSADAVVYRSKDHKKRLYVYWDGTKEVKSV